MRHYEHHGDYQHIKKYGMIKGYDENFIKGQQKLAYLINAPYDTVEIVEGKVILFKDLPAEVRKQFGMED